MGKQLFKKIEMETGLFFGSFNPIHIGHLIIAEAVLNETNLKEVWYIVTPHNPLKSSKSLAPEHDRLRMVELAIEGHYQFRVSDIEFRLPKPNYTIHTLASLREKYPERSFSLIIGGDNLQQLPKWKHYDQIVRDFGLIVYPRLSAMISSPVESDKIKLIDAPLLNISATYIRKRIKEEKSVKYLIPDLVSDYIRNQYLYH